MNRHIHKFIKKNFGAFASMISVIAVISAFVAYCVLHLFWLNSFSNQSDPYLAELRIASTTIYFLVFICAFFALTQVGKATISHFARDFAQWRILGFTPKEIHRLQLLIIVYLSLIGSFIGTLIASVTAHFVLPLLNDMAAGSGIKPHTILKYKYSLVGALLAFIGSVITNVVAGYNSSRYTLTINPLILFRDRSYDLEEHRFSKLKIVAGWSCFVYGLMLLLSGNYFIKSLNGGLESVYNFSMNIGIGFALAIYFFLDKILKIIGRLIEGIGKAHIHRKILLSYVLNEMHVSKTGIKPLFAGLCFGGILIASSKAVVVYADSQKQGIHANFADTFFIVAIIAITVIATAIAILSLQFPRKIQVDLLLFQQGVTYVESIKISIQTAFYLTCLIVFSSLIPLVLISVFSVIMAGLAGSSVFALVLFSGILCFVVVFLLMSVIYVSPVLKTYKKPEALMREIHLKN